MRLWIFVSNILGVALLAYGEQPACPPSKEVYPCYCDDSDYLLTSVGCTGFSGLEKLLPVLKNTRGSGVSFAFWKSRLGDVPSDFFEGHKSVNLHFEHCQIGSFGDRPFSGLEDTLNRIYIYGSVDKRRKDLETFPLGHLKSLESMAFQANDIKKLGNDWFKGGPISLKELNLEANDIEQLGDRAFADLANLQQIWLGDNSFKKVSRSMFPRPANKLQMLEMSFGGIEELPNDMFEDMPALKYINVSGNKLKTLDEAVFGKIWKQIAEVYFERNSGFECDSRIKWIFRQKLPTRFFGGTCGGGNKLSGKKLQDLKLEDFEGM